jgi:putative transposase
LDALRPKPREGLAPKLSREKQEELKQRGNWTTKEAGSLVQDRFGVKYSLRSMRRILRSLGMKYAKPYPRDYRRPQTAEGKLKTAVEASLEGASNVLLGFFDECRPQTGANTQRVWSFGIIGLNFGFYAPDGRSVISFMENSKKESVCTFLEEVRANNPDENIVLILDNFRSHRSEATRQKAQELDIRLTYLPPYSPGLNPIEQVWRCLKREISTACFRTETEFLTLIQKTYHGLSNRLSFAKGWIQKFIPHQFNQLCP